MTALPCAIAVFPQRGQLPIRAVIAERQQAVDALLSQQQQQSDNDSHGGGTSNKQQQLSNELAAAQRQLQLLQRHQRALSGKRDTDSSDEQPCVYYNKGL